MQLPAITSTHFGMRHLLLSILLILPLLGPSIALGGEHAEPEGLLIRQDGEVAAIVWEGVASGEIEVHHEETTSDLEVSFLDADSIEFVLDVEDGFALYAELADSAAVDYAQTGDWTFTLTGVLEGITSMQVGVFHIDHVDWLSPDIEVHVEEEHAEPEGLVVRQDGEVAVVVWEGVASGEIEVFHEMTTSDLVVSFLDADSAEFVPEVGEGFALYAELADSAAVEYAQTGDWTYTLTGVQLGVTAMQVGIFHIDHLDWLSPDIEVHVEEEHAEAEGLVVRLDGVEQVRIFEGVVQGQLYVGEGVEFGPYEVSFLDEHGDEFQPEVEEGFSLSVDIDDPGILSYSQAGDWSMNLEGIVSGSAGLVIGIFHETHLDYESQVIPVSVGSPADVGNSSAPLLTALSTPFPNPVSNGTTLRLQLAKPSQVQLGVFDTTGRLVEQVFSGTMQAGERAIDWTPGRLPSGTYFVRMVTPDRTLTTRMVVTR